MISYFLFSTLSYFFIFDKLTKKHPRFLKNQIRMEIVQSLKAMPLMTLFTTPWFLAEIHGFSKIYENPLKYGKLYYIIQFPLFLVFTDGLIYLIHRALHHRILYKRLHKSHHRWIIPTPYASYAFHPLDGYLQSIPYHVFPFIFPLHRYVYLGMFIFVNLWTILIRFEFVTLNPVVNGSACHSIHHLLFNYNYGQFFTLFDRLGGSYRVPDVFMVHPDRKKEKAFIDAQISAMESIQKTVEGEDDRSYIVDKKIN
ncbi:hypothetical protein PORY_002464 [Pneumocystis oryctolagi]|uniref:Uncharacterized protein n=1 Tax=Pneumocystis oryctolagi TaxID=42067 RepID=A0ACB7C9I4_9ASCO|nr:hypothetical protein PORY_002464 [Pneumocystis oryctolagi]